MRRLTTEDVVKQFITKHGDKYDYSQFVYQGDAIKGTIICTKHGPFEQSPTHHKGNRGCPGCGRDTLSKRFTADQKSVIEKCIVIHGNKYDYSKVQYENDKTPIEIICLAHGSFFQTPNNPPQRQRLHPMFWYVHQDH